MLKKLLAFTCLTLSIGANAAAVVTSTVGQGEWGLIQFDWAGGAIDINGYARGVSTGPTGMARILRAYLIGPVLINGVTYET